MRTERQGLRRIKRFGSLCAGCAMLAVGRQAAASEPVVLLDPAEASLRIGQEAVGVARLEDQFGAGLHGVVLRGVPSSSAAQLEWRLPVDFPKGEYALGLLSSAGEREGEYFHWSGFRAAQLHVYHNDRRVRWDGYTWPDRPEDAAGEGLQAELRTGTLLRLSPGDSLRVVFASDRGSVVVGPLRLHAVVPGLDIRLPQHAAERLSPGEVQWLNARWASAPSKGDSEPGAVLGETAVFFNPLGTAVTFSIRASATDYLGRILLEAEETITLAPGVETVREYSFRPDDIGPHRLSVIAESDAYPPPRRLVRYFGANRTQLPRPRFSLNGAWEFCYAPGVEPGDAPPADAGWTSVNVPSWHSNEKAHLGWFRKRFIPPDSIAGERILLRFGSVYSEAWVHVNGTLVHHQHLGSTPFEADITDSFRQGGANEVLVAVRDWLAYSPANRERVLRGERPVPKADMHAAAAYTGMSNLGIACSVWLEARPALAVDDVFVATRTAERTLTLRYRIRNDGAEAHEATIRPVVLERGVPVLRLAERTVQVAAGETATFLLEESWPEARLWWPEDPHLYVLETEVSGGATPDRHLQRFGFRDAHMEGISFHLNHRRMKLRTQWNAGAHGMGGRLRTMVPEGTPERRLEHMWRWQMHSREERFVQLSRTHLTRAGAEEACDVADETGLMLKIESDLGQEGFTLDERFWNATIHHNVAMVDAFKNHPSVVQWSAGNENMWGWHYLGAAAQEVGTRWQVAIANAMQEFDLQRRPVDWSADGDLKGNWSYYSLHYPRELSRNPDLPNSAWWGPLDGTTLVPYSMGPIVLGSKPIITGETFWPRMLRRPFGQTILYGDAAFTGPAFQHAGWIDSTAFFLNGFRDAEFAMIDTYVPLSLLKPEMVVLKEETHSFYGGRTLVRHLNVHHDLPTAGFRVLAWVLAGDDGDIWAEGSQALELEPAELHRMRIEVALPKTESIRKAVFTVELRADAAVRHREQRIWHVHPAPTSAVLPVAHAVSLYDPKGDTAALFERMGVPFLRLQELRAPASGALVIGRDAFGEGSAAPWAASLADFTAAGGRVAVMEQRHLPTFLPVALTPVTGREATLAFVRAADHPVMAGIGDDDLRWWADDHVVSRNHFRKPLGGNVLPLADLGTIEGMTESPLLEVYNGQGSYLLCQLLLEEKAFLSPAAGRIFLNLVGSLARKTPFRTTGPVALFAGGNEALGAALERLQVRSVNLSETPETLDSGRHAGALADASALADVRTAAALRRYAEAGGRVWIHRVGPAQIAAVEVLAGVRLRLRPVEEAPRDIQNRVLRTKNSGWLAGISNHDLFWGSSRYLQQLRQEGNWSENYPGACPPEERIADYHVFPTGLEAHRATLLTHPPTLLQIPVGDGEVVVNQLRLESPPADLAVTVDRLFSMLLTHLGAAMGEGTVLRPREDRLRDYVFFPVDLSAHANRGLRDDPEVGITGWTNQGENDARNLPAGRQMFGGVSFEIATPRAAVVLHSRHAANTELPKEVSGIRIDRHADALFFLHTAAWGGSGLLFGYRVHYEDGSKEEIPIIGGRQVYDWWTDPNSVAGTMERHGAFVAWQGSNPMRDPVMLSGYEWTNPHPAKRIAGIDFLTAEGSQAVAVLAGITAAVFGGVEGEVTDVRGTAGLRVRIDGRDREIDYVGVVGLEAAHPYHEQAVAAHRERMLGARVVLEYGAVRANDEGRMIAYVFIAGDRGKPDRTLINGWLIGEGLGRLGNFAGNTRHAEYLENMQFISRQRGQGLWGVRE